MGLIDSKIEKRSRNHLMKSRPNEKWYRYHLIKPCPNEKWCHYHLMKVCLMKRGVVII